MLVRSSLVVAAMVIALTLAGCIGSQQAPPAPSEQPRPAATNNSTSPVLPDGRGISSGNSETNKTVNGTFGSSHVHDYWGGKEVLTILERDIPFYPTPLLPDGQGTNPKSVAYVKLTPGKMVFEGTDKVTFEAGAVSVQNVAEPAINLFLQYRTAADSEFRAPVQLTPGSPLTIQVATKETDMPHSVLSLWVFRLTTDRPDSGTTHFKITIHRGSAIVNWPGHPDFYAAGDTRVVSANQHVKTHMIGIAEGLLYDQGATWATPQKLISWGTGTLYVFMNVTAVSSSIPGATPTGYFLEFHNATDIGPEVLFGNRSAQPMPAGDPGSPLQRGDLKHYAWKIPVDAGGMDGPYQPTSRWGFRMMATFAETPVASLCPGCFSYDIEYDMTILAVHDPNAPAMVM